MLRYTHGNVLEAPVEALVNTVNEVGVTGKGIALMFREAFPEAAREYEQAAKNGPVHVGRMLVTRNSGLVGPRWIINFPTKKHWRNPSKLEWVRVQAAVATAERRQSDRSIKTLQLTDPLKLDFVAPQVRAVCRSASASTERPGRKLSALRTAVERRRPARSHLVRRLGARDHPTFLKSSEAAVYQPALERTAALIDGFESPLGMELLATADWLMLRGSQPTVQGMRKGLSTWPGGASAGRRKSRLLPAA